MQERRYLDEDGVYCNALAPEDFRTLAEESGLEVLKLIGKPVLCQYLGEETKRCVLGDPEETGKLLEIELSLCGRPSLVGAGSYLQLVARKGGSLVPGRQKPGRRGPDRAKLYSFSH